MEEQNTLSFLPKDKENKWVEYIYVAYKKPYVNVIKAVILTSPSLGPKLELNIKNEFILAFISSIFKT